MYAQISFLLTPRKFLNSNRVYGLCQDFLVRLTPDRPQRVPKLGLSHKQSGDGAVGPSELQRPRLRVDATVPGKFGKHVNAELHSSPLDLANSKMQ